MQLAHPWHCLDQQALFQFKSCIEPSPSSTRLLKLLYPQGDTGQARATGLLAAGIWMVHPLQVSTVLYSVQRMAQLSALFMVLALLVCLRLVQDRDETLTRGRALLAAAGFWMLTLLAVLSKENGILAPVLLLAIWLSLPVVTRRMFTADNARRILFALTGWLPVAAGAVLALFLLNWIAAGYASREFTLVERVLTQPYVLAQYLQSILVPDYRHMGLYLDDIPVRGAADYLAWLLLSVTLALPVLALALRHRAPVLCFAVLWFYACHTLESTIIPLEMAFEHLEEGRFRHDHHYRIDVIELPVQSLRERAEDIPASLKCAR